MEDLRNECDRHLEICKNDTSDTCIMESSYSHGVSMDLSLDSLEKELKVTDENFAHYQDFVDAVHSLVGNIKKELECVREPIIGSFIRVGSSRDGTRPGNLLEIDYLFEREVTSLMLCQYKPTQYKVYDELMDCELNPSHLNQRFRDTIDELFLRQLELPNGLEHTGFAKPKFSGTRRNGPATTLLFRWKGKYDVSVDITFALPLPQEKEEEFKKKVLERYDCIRKDNPETSFDINTKMHLIPKAPEDKVWEVTTSSLETNIIHQLHASAPVKRIIKFSKIIIDKLAQNTRQNTVLPETGSDAHEATKEIVNLLQFYKDNQHKREEPDIRGDIIKAMRYAHIFVPPEIAKANGELVKSITPIRSFAIKHAALVEGAKHPGLFSPTSDKQKLDTLLTTVLDQISNSECSDVPHFFLNNISIPVLSWTGRSKDDQSRLADVAKTQCQLIVLKLQRKDEPKDFLKEKSLTQWTFECRNCHALAFTSTSLRRADAEHYFIVGDPEFFNKISLEKFTEYKEFGNCVKTHDMYCRVCHEDWGIISDYIDVYKMIPLVRFKGFLVKNPIGMVQKYNKWSKVPEHVVLTLDIQKDLRIPEQSVTE